MTIAVTSLPLNNATKPALVGLLTGWNSSASAAIPITCNFSPTANPNNYFAISRQRSDDNLERGGSPSRLTMRSRSMRRSTGPSTLTATPGQRVATPSAGASARCGTSSR